MPPLDDRWYALFASIDAKQTSQFLSHLTPDATFRYGSFPPATGHAAIAAAVDQFFASIRSSEHRIIRVWQQPDSAIFQGEVTYVRLDGATVVVPFCNVFALKGDRIFRYDIYIDPAPLLAATVAPGADRVAAE